MPENHAPSVGRNSEIGRDFVETYLTFYPLVCHVAPGGETLCSQQATNVSVPYTQQVSSGTMVGVTAPASFAPATNSGIQYVFTGWSDGITTATRSTTGTASDTSYTANYKEQVFVTVIIVPTGAGTVNGGGWIDLTNGTAELTETPNSGYYFNDYRLPNGTTSLLSTLTIEGTQQPYSVTAEFLAFSPCDIEHTRSVTVTDAQLVINEALGVALPANDLSGDGVVNALDIQIEINAAISSVCAAK